MSITSLSYPVRRANLAARVADYVELTKPKISVLVLVTVAVAAFLAGWGSLDPLVLLHALVGTTLVAASASALNQWLERDIDARMPRTADRPLPSGRLASGEVLLFGAVTIIAGLVYLTWLVNPLTAALGLATWVSYVWIYTPLKQKSAANTAVGAVAGALPVLMGWASTGQPLGLAACTLFAIVYLWQFPHFMAIAWLYRLQYAQAGLQMLPVVDPSGRRAGLQALWSAMILLPVSLLPVAQHLAGPRFAAAVLALGVGQLIVVLQFVNEKNDVTARRLLRASLIYLPGLLFLFLLIPMI